jgi:hypothetical protein
LGSTTSAAAACPNRYAAFAADGVQLNVLDVDQSLITCHAAPLWSSHLYCCGVAPPLGVAVKVMVVLAGCGAGWFAVSATADNLAVVVVGGGGGGGVAVVGAEMGKSMLIVASPASTVLPAPRTHTPNRYAAFAADGVQLKVLDVVHSLMTCHDAPLCSNHLYCCGVAPPFGVAVRVIVVFAGCGAGMFAVSATADSLAVVVAGGGAAGDVVVVAADTG